MKPIVRRSDFGVNDERNTGGHFSVSGSDTRLSPRLSSRWSILREACKTRLREEATGTSLLRSQNTEDRRFEHDAESFFHEFVRSANHRVSGDLVDTPGQQDSKLDGVLALFGKHW